MAASKTPADEPGQHPQQSQQSTRVWLMVLGSMSVVALLAGAGAGTVLVPVVEQKISQASAKEGDAPAHPVNYSNGEVVVDMPPVLTNLIKPRKVWLRFEGALIFNDDPGSHGSVLATEVAGDFLGFFRTLPIGYFEGASGLQHLKADLSDRAMARSDGQVREVVIKTLVVE